MQNLAHRTMKQTSAKRGNEGVLLIEAEATDAARILDQLSSIAEQRFHVEWFTELASAIERLRSGGVGAVVLDLELPENEGIEAFEKLFQFAPHLPILILSGADTEEMAREAVRRGAQEYLIKNQSRGYRLRRTLCRMIDQHAADALLLENEVTNLPLDSIEEAVLRTDSRGNVTYLNRIAEGMTGWRREEVRGRPVAD